MLESRIQADIVKALFKAGYFCHSIPNEQGHGNAIRTGQLISMGLRPGCADLVVWLKSGRIAYLEVKNEKGQQSDRQIAFEKTCQSHGYPYKVVRSVEEAMEFINGLQVV